VDEGKPGSVVTPKKRPRRGCRRMKSKVKATKKMAGSMASVRWFIA
jgi:hypothetical protein